MMLPLCCCCWPCRTAGESVREALKAHAARDPLYAASALPTMAVLLPRQAFLGHACSSSRSLQNSDNEHSTERGLAGDGLRYLHQRWSFEISSRKRS